MKKTFTAPILILLFFTFIIGKAQEPLNNDVENKRYVLVPNGLSLRKEKTLKSERITVMPLRSEVTLLKEPLGNTFEVEHIKGSMIKVLFNDTIGYCFSGYLSQLPLPKKTQSAQAYIDELKEQFSGTSFKTKPNSPDFHQGSTDTFTLPTTSWHEAYYIVCALYKIPKSLGFPNPSGPKKETIPQPDKPKKTWSSELSITRKDNTLTSINYFLRLEGFGTSITIIRLDNGFFQVEDLAYVD